MFVQLLNILYSRIGRYQVIETDVGLKVIGSCNVNEAINSFVVESWHFADSNYEFDDFVLGPDYLVDSHSLVGVPITKSAHYSLMEVLANKRRLVDTDYARKKKMGTLDWSWGREINVHKTTERFSQRLDDIQQGNEITVEVYPSELKGRSVFIISDGKHRLAQLAYFECKPNLKVLLLSYDAGKTPPFPSIYNRMLEQPARYTKNIDMLRRFYAKH